jgi:hypothetical protein
MGAVAQFSAAQFRSQNPHLAGPTYAFLLQTDLNLAAKQNYFTFSISQFSLFAQQIGPDLVRLRQSLEIWLLVLSLQRLWQTIVDKTLPPKRPAIRFYSFNACRICDKMHILNRKPFFKIRS